MSQGCPQGQEPGSCQGRRGQGQIWRQPGGSPPCKRPPGSADCSAALCFRSERCVLKQISASAQFEHFLRPSNQVYQLNCALKHVLVSSTVQGCSRLVGFGMCTDYMSEEHAAKLGETLTVLVLAGCVLRRNAWQSEASLNKINGMSHGRCQRSSSAATSWPLAVKSSTVNCSFTSGESLGHGRRRLDYSSLTIHANSRLRHDVSMGTEPGVIANVLTGISRRCGSLFPPHCSLLEKSSGNVQPASQG